MLAGSDALLAYRANFPAQRSSRMRNWISLIGWHRQRQTKKVPTRREKAQKLARRQTLKKVKKAKKANEHCRSDNVPVARLRQNDELYHNATDNL